MSKGSQRAKQESVRGEMGFRVKAHSRSLVWAALGECE